MDFKAASKVLSLLHHHNDFSIQISGGAGKYKTLHDFPNNIKLYDISASELDDLSSGKGQQKQFMSLNGAVLIVDTSKPPESSGYEISLLASEIKKLKGLRTDKILKTPAAVVISSPELNTDDDNICRNFLSSNNFSSVMNIIEGEFINVKYFANPVGIIEPVKWLLSTNNSSLHKLISTPAPTNHMPRKVPALIYYSLVILPLLLGLYFVPYEKIKSLILTEKPKLPARPANTTPPQLEQIVFQASTLGTNIRVRESPNTTSRTITTLNNEGAPVDVIDQVITSGGTWYFVILPDKRRGWIHSSNLQGRLGDTGSHGGEYMTVRSNGVILRAMPNTRSGGLVRLNTGNLVESVNQRTIRREVWHQVYTQTGQLGWIQNRYLRRR